jgi:hypothetical protein
MNKDLEKKTEGKNATLRWLKIQKMPSSKSLKFRGITLGHSYTHS